MKRASPKFDDWAIPYQPWQYDSGHRPTQPPLASRLSQCSGHLGMNHKLDNIRRILSSNRHWERCDPHPTRRSISSITMPPPPVTAMEMQAVDTAAKEPLQIQTTSLRPSGEPSPRRGRLPSTASSTPARRLLWKPRKYHKWESPVLMVLFFVLGLGISMAHCGFYASLEGAIVGSPAQQENNLRRVTKEHGVGAIP